MRRLTFLLLLWALPTWAANISGSSVRMTTPPGATLSNLVDGSYNVTIKPKEVMTPSLAAPLSYWGVKADGVADDTVAMQAAVNSGWASFSAPNGVIKLSATITVSNPIKFVGQGPINSNAKNLQGTLIWQTAAAPCITVTGSAEDSVLRDFDMVSEGDGLKISGVSRCTIQNVRVRKGTRGKGFIAEQAYSTKFIACGCATNGLTPYSWTTGFNGSMTYGFYVTKGATYGSNATELVDCYAAGASVAGVHAGDAALTYMNITGGTYEGNTINIDLNSLYEANIYGAHLEGPGTNNLVITDSHRVKVTGASNYGAVAASVRLIRSDWCEFYGMSITTLLIESGSNHNRFRGCTFNQVGVADYGEGNIFEDCSQNDWANMTGTNGGMITGTGRTGVVNLVTDGLFERWVGNTPIDWVIEASLTSTKETTIVKDGTNALKVVSTGASPTNGVRFNNVGSGLHSSFVTISCWRYLPTAGSDAYAGIKLYGLNVGKLFYETLTASDRDKWIHKSYTFYVGEPGSATRTGSIDAVLIPGYTGGATAYYSAVQIVDGFPAQRFMPYGNTAEQRFAGHRVFYSAAAPTGGGIQGDRAINSAATVGQPKGWLCTVSHATAATWVSEGNL